MCQELPPHRDREALRGQLLPHEFVHKPLWQVLAVRTAPRCGRLCVMRLEPRGPPLGQRSCHRGLRTWSKRGYVEVHGARGPSGSMDMCLMCLREAPVCLCMLWVVTTGSQRHGLSVPHTSQQRHAASPSTSKSSPTAATVPLVSNHFKRKHPQEPQQQQPQAEPARASATAASCRTCKSLSNSRTRKIPQHQALP